MRRPLALIAALSLATLVVLLRSGGTPAHATTPIRHVVIIDEENHSFDDVLGKFCAEQRSGSIVRAGSNDPCDGATRATLSDGNQYALTEEPDYGLRIIHSVDAQQTAIDGGGMDGFDSINDCTATSTPPYGCLTQLDALSGTCGSDGTQTCIPNAVRLAEHFAISDRTFEFRQTPSWAGHMILGSATLQNFKGNNPNVTPPGVKAGPGWGCDSNKLTPWLSGSGRTHSALVPSCVPDQSGSMGPAWDGTSYAMGSHATYVPTIFDRLDAAHLPWKIYGGSGGPGGATGPAGYGWTICPTFWECLGSSQRQHLVPNSDVFTDAQNGTLPPVSFVTPISTYSEHQPASVSAGDNWVGSVVSAIMASPDWSSTAIFLTWDDCGCFYDHVNPLQYNSGWGVRVPMIIVSPYARAGYSDSSPATFVSMLAFVEHTFGLPSLNPCATVGRKDRTCTDDANAYDYSNAFDFTQTSLTPVAMTRTSVPSVEQRWIAAHPDAGDEGT